MNIALNIVRKVFILNSMESQLFNPGCDGLFQQGLVIFASGGVKIP